MTAEYDDETLVAFLDGELDAAQTQEIEALLPGDPELQQRLTLLRQTWDLLEDMPLPVPDKKFAASTMEMIALTEDLPSTGWQVWLARNSARLLCIVLPLFFGAGFFLNNASQNRSKRELLRDLPLLIDWRSLNNIDSEEWLDVLAEESELATAFAGVTMNTIGGGAVPNSIEEREQWVQKLTDSDRLRLKDALEEFRQRSPEMQMKMREIAAPLIAAPADSQRLGQAIRGYTRLLQDLSLTQRASLKDMPISQRKEELKRLLNWQMVVNFRQNLSEYDSDAIRDWSQNLIDKYPISYPWDAPRSVYYELTDKWQFSEIGERDLLELEEGLSSEAQAILRRFEDSKSHFEVLIFWLAKIAFPQDTPAEKFDADKLRKSYAELKGNDLEKIELMPPDDVPSALRKLSTKTRPSESIRGQE